MASASRSWFNIKGNQRRTQIETMEEHCFQGSVSDSCVFLLLVSIGQSPPSNGGLGCLTLIKDQDYDPYRNVTGQTQWAVPSQVTLDC